MYFLFLIPDGQGSDNFREEVMQALEAAVRGSTAYSVLPSNRGGSVASGFRIKGEGSTVRVYRPTVTSLYEDREALQVRAERQVSSNSSTTGAR